VLILLVALFHRPLFHHGVRFALVRGAALQGLQLDLRLSGTVWTDLIIDGVRVEATGAKPTPVRRIAIEHLRFDYSIPALLKHGIGEFLQSYAVRHATLEFVALPSASEKEKKEKRAIALQLNDLLAQPAAYADRVHIEDFNVTVTAPENVTRVLGFHLLLDPEQPGHLRIAQLEIPGVPLWENLAAETSYTDRNLFIKELTLAPELVVEELNFDASRRAQNIAGFWLKLRAFGGLATISLEGSQLNRRGENLAQSYDTRLAIVVSDLALPAAAKYFGAPPPPIERLSRFTVHFTGEPERPRTWQGDLSLALEGLAAGTALTLDRVALEAVFHDGRARITPMQVSAGKNTVNLQAEVLLPESVNEFPSSEIEATLQLDAPDLPHLTRVQPMTGQVAGTGKVTLRQRQLAVQLDLTATELAGAGLTLRSAKVALRASKSLDAPPAEPLAALDGRLTADLTALQFGTVAIDGASAEIEARTPVITLHRLEIRRGDNTISAQGTARLPADLKEIARAPIDAEFTVHAPKLEAFGLGVKETILAGQLEARGVVKVVEGAPTGDITVDGTRFAFGDFRPQSLGAKIHLADQKATVEQFALRFNDSDAVTLTGAAGLQPPYAYGAELRIAVRDLAIFQPLLAIFGVKEALTGKLNVEWAGTGEVQPAAAPSPTEPAPWPKHDGSLTLAVNQARYGKVELNDLLVAGQYRPGFAESTDFRLKSGPTALTGKVQLEGETLRLLDLKLTQAGTTVLTGSLRFPFEALARPLAPFDDRLAVNLSATNLDLEKLLGSFGQKSPATGTLTASLIASGTIQAPVADLKLAGRRLRALAVPQLEPSDLDVRVHYQARQLELNATLRPPKMQPLTVQGRVPLDLQATIKARQLDPQLPLDLTARLPPSSLAIVPSLTPQVARIDGTAGFDVRVAGTVARPVVTGNLTVALKNARLANENVPAIGAFDARLAFAGDTLTFERFRGGIGGGSFELAGNVKLADPKDPVFDLRMRSKEILVKRDEAVTVRADTDLRIAGPLKAGTVTGDVFVTHSRFFKEIDILPIGLPGRSPPPSPKTANKGPGVISFPEPPLRDWKFDIAIRTRPEDPFLVRGNLANGAVALNLRLAGTGLEPYLDGNVRIDKFVASLPFSTLSVTRGFVYFTKDAPFEPTLDIQAESKARDYTVGAYIHGTPGAPEIELTSEPPLSHADIVSLLATGATTSELAGNADVLASRAAILAVQSLYRKIFRRGAAPPPEPKSGNGSALDRFQLELGAVDNRTGAREITTRFKINDHYFLIGDINTNGRFTGRLKYLIRFR